MDQARSFTFEMFFPSPHFAILQAITLISVAYLSMSTLHNVLPGSFPNVLTGNDLYSVRGAVTVVDALAMGPWSC